MTGGVNLCGGPKQRLLMKYKVIMYLMIMFLVLTQVFTLSGAESVADTPNSWIAKAPWPLGDSGYAAGGAAVLNGIIYVTSTNGNYFYNPATDKWSAFAPMPTPRGAAAVVACDNKIYVLGGKEESAYNSSRVNEMYDPSTDTWVTKAPMPVGASQMEAEAVNNKIYVIGGADGAEPSNPTYGTNYPTVNITEIYNPVTDSWTIGTPIPYPVRSYASAVVDNKIYVIGGQDEFYPNITLAFTQTRSGH